MQFERTSRWFQRACRGDALPARLGVVAGPFYLVVALAQAVTNSQFDLARHALTVLMLADWGWVQRTNLILVGLMVLAAAWGFTRAMGGKAVGVALGVYGVSLIASGVFAPDPVEGFPEASSEPEASLSGILHLFVGFVGLAVAAFAFARWCKRRSAGAWSTYSIVSGAIIIVGFAGGAALSTTIAGVLSLWIAVLAGLAWLAAASVLAYRTVPHPDAERRAPAR